MDFGKAFSYQFDDENWLKKILLNGLLSIIPFYGIGWILSIMKRVQEDHPAPLPDGFDIGGNFILGLKGFVVGLVYSIPVIIVYLPAGIFPAILSMADGDTAQALTVVASISTICCSGLAIILSLGITLLIPAAYGRLNINGSIGDALQFKEVFNMVKSNVGAFLFVLLGSILAGLIGQLGVIVCVVGLLFTMPYAMTIMAHLYAQAYKVASVSAVE